MAKATLRPSTAFVVCRRLPANMATRLTGREIIQIEKVLRSYLRRSALNSLSTNSTHLLTSSLLLPPNAFTAIFCVLEAHNEENLIVIIILLMSKTKHGASE